MDTVYKWHKYRKRSRPVDAVHNIFDTSINITTECGWFSVDPNDWLVVLKNEFNANPIVVIMSHKAFTDQYTPMHYAKDGGQNDKNTSGT